MEIVSVVRRALAERVGQDRYELWLSKQTGFQIEEGALVVLAANTFLLERIRKLFRDDLAFVAQEVIGSSRVSFRVARQLAACGKAASHDACGEHRLAAHAGTPRPRLSLVGGVAGAGGGALVAEAPPPAAPPAADRPRRVLASLESFVVGDNNRVAHAAARALESRLGFVSPLYLHGPTGCGKTHLLEGIAQAVRRGARQRRVISLSAEQFTSYFLEALQGSGLPMFRRKYRDVDLLLVDDVQFFAGKKATLVELQHTMDTLARAGKQLVLAADRPPAELQSLGSELVARMSGGLVVGIEPPDAATRHGILARFAAQLSVAVPEDVLQWLAGQLAGDARQLRGALHRIAAASEAFEQPVTLDLAIKATRDLIAATRRSVQLVDIERAVCNVFGVTPDVLHAERRSRKSSLPRMLAMWLARKHTRSALTEIGEYFGRKSHSTVIAAHNNVERWRAGGTSIRLSAGDCGIDDAIRRVEAELRLA